MFGDEIRVDAPQELAATAQIRLGRSGRSSVSLWGRLDMEAASLPMRQLLRATCLPVSLKDKFCCTLFGMTTLHDLVPNVEDVLAMPPADLAPCLLLLAKEHRQNNMFQPDAVPTLHQGVGIAPPGPLYPIPRMHELERAVAAGWQWLRNQNLIAHSPGINGRNGWTEVTAEGERINSAEDIIRFRAAAAFPRELLHPEIAGPVHAHLMGGRYDDAVLHALRAVEIAVRQAGGFGANDVGTDLMRRAFAPNGGPLTDTSVPVPEREAMAHLFAGAIGAFRNPHAHRQMNIADVRVAQDQVLLASHLLRILDTRRRPGA